MERKQFLFTSLMAGLGLSALADPLRDITASKGPLQPFYIAPDETLLDPGPAGLAIRIKVRSGQTNMQFSCVDVAVAPKKMGPPPHVHEALEELMYVYEGTMSVMVGSTVYQVPAGGWHLRPRGIPHTFWNATDKIVRCTDMYFNQNFEEFLEELFFKVAPELAKNPNNTAMINRVAELDKLFGIKSFHEQRQPIIDKYGLKS